MHIPSTNTPINTDCGCFTHWEHERCITVNYTKWINTGGTRPLDQGTEFTLLLLFWKLFLWTQHWGFAKWQLVINEQKESNVIQPQKISLSIPLNFSILKSWNAANRKLCFALLYFNRAQHGLTWAKSERRPKEKLGQECWSTSDLTGCPQWASDGMCSSGSLYCWYSSSVDKQKHLILEADKQTSFIRAKTDTLQSNVQLSLILIRKLPFDFNFREMISSHVAKQ